MKFDSTDLSLAKKMDSDDPLKDFKKQFAPAKPNEIYLNGNSLGPLPIKTKEILEKVINYEWGEQIVRGWGEGWYELSQRVGYGIAKIIGAKKTEVVAGDSTSLNLYKLAFAAMNYQKGKTKIVSDEFNFPSDIYVIQGLIKESFPNHKLELVKSRDEITVDINDIKDAIDENTALVTLSHVCFKSGYLHNIKEITKIAHEKGALVLWDLSHSGGVVDVKLNEADVDLAVGCTYKYMNGGPGAPAYLFVKEELQDKLSMPISGWFGSANPFDFSLDFKPAKGINKFLVGTPPILSLSAVETSIDLILEAGIKNIREKSVLQTDYLIYLAEKILVPLGFKINSPNDSSRRGSHIALVKDDAFSISQAIKNNAETSVIFDFRKPGIIRLSTSPLYNTYEDLWRAVNIINNTVKKDDYEKLEMSNGVT